jgi:Flp pilus assembly pilin Flp
MRRESPAQRPVGGRKGKRSNMRGTNLRSEHAQTMAEYGVILAVITVTIVAAVAFLGSQILAVLERVAALIG